MKEPQKKVTIAGIPRELRENWSVFFFYERFEQIIALILTAAISVVIFSALIRLLRYVFEFLVLGVLSPTDYVVFQTVFVMIMTLVIATEFKHSILRVVARRGSIIQVQSVVLIALLALRESSSSSISKTTSRETLAALAFALTALGMTYWLMRERDDRSAKSQHQLDSSPFPRASLERR